jgi:DNA polymerase I-like protein with 3'-5' exonuclease and polymerase domains
MLSIKNPETYDWANIPLLDCIEGNAMDSTVTLELYEIFQKILVDSKLDTLNDKLLAKGQEAFIEMEYEGIDVDINEIDKIDEEISSILENLSSKLLSKRVVPDEVNLNSDTQMAGVLFLNEEGLCLFPPDYTDTGAPKMDKDTIKILLSQIEIELKKRGESKEKNTEG